MVNLIAMMFGLSFLTSAASCQYHVRIIQTGLTSHEGINHNLRCITQFELEPTDIGTHKKFDPESCAAIRNPCFVLLANFIFFCRFV